MKKQDPRLASRSRRQAHKARIEGERKAARKRALAPYRQRLIEIDTIAVVQRRRKIAEEMPHRRDWKR